MKSLTKRIMCTTCELNESSAESHAKRNESCVKNHVKINQSHLKNHVRMIKSCKITAENKQISKHVIIIELCTKKKNHMINESCDKKHLKITEPKNVKRNECLKITCETNEAGEKKSCAK